MHERQQYRCVYATKAVRGVIIRYNTLQKKHKPVCYLFLIRLHNKTYVELLYANQREKKTENEYPAPEKMLTIQHLCMYVRIRTNNNNLDRMAIDYCGCSHVTNTTRGLLVIKESKPTK